MIDLWSTFIVQNETDLHQSLLLKRWFVPAYLEHKLAKFAKISRADNSLVEVEEEENVTQAKVRGWYQPYTEGTFCLFKDDSNQWAVYCNGQLLSLTPEHRVSWENKILGRALRIYKGDSLVFSFRHHTWRTLLKDPFCIFDDYWGVTEDLPNFLGTHFEDFEHLDRSLEVECNS